jgi:hypothetical protein
VAGVDPALFELAANQPAMFVVAERPHISSPQSQRSARTQRRRHLSAKQTAAAGDADLLSGAGQLRDSIDEINGVLADPDYVE